MSIDTPPSPDFFVAGGTMRHSEPSYVKRPADDELFRAIMSSAYCYLLTPRQMGKSSLMVRTARRLHSHGVRTAIIDLTQIGADVSPDQWYLGLLTRLKSQLSLSVNVESWWAAHRPLSPVQRFTRFLRDELLAKTQAPIVIFIDEIDYTLSLDWSDPFFAAIRAAFNNRAFDPIYERLTFVLLGVATPADLIQDPTSTPFNIGHRLNLREFSREDARVLLEGLQTVLPQNGEAVFDRIFYWTNGQPYLAQKLCAEVVMSGHDSWTNDDVDRLVEEQFLSKKAQREPNLQFVREYIHASPYEHDLLKLYQQVYQGKKIDEDERSIPQNQLKVIGLLQVNRGQLEVRNRIYHHVFNQEWLDDLMPASRTHRLVAILALLAILIVSGIFVLTQKPDIIQNIIALLAPPSTVTPTSTATQIRITDTIPALVATSTPTATATPTTPPPLPGDTGTPTPSPTATPTSTPAEIDTPTQTPSLTVTSTSTPSPTNTPTSTPPLPNTPTKPPPPPPTPEILDFTCDEPVYEFITTQTVQFRWRWTGQLTGNEYLELRIGPRGSVFLNSEGIVSDQQGPIWTWLVPASQFFQETAFDYEWEVVHMAADGQTVIARSDRGCIHVEPPQ